MPALQDNAEGGQIPTSEVRHARVLTPPNKCSMNRPASPALARAAHFAASAATRLPNSSPGISDQSKLLVVTKSRLNLARGRHRSVSSLCCFMRSAQLAEQQGSSTMLAIALNWKERLLRSLVEDT